MDPEGDIFRIYFSEARWSDRSSIGSVIVDAVGGRFSVRRSRFCTDARGIFDDCGVSIGSIVRAGDTRLCTTGRNMSRTSFIGVAISETSTAFERPVCFFPSLLDGVIHSRSPPWSHQMEDIPYVVWLKSRLGEGTDEIPHVLRYAQSGRCPLEKQDACISFYKPGSTIARPVGRASSTMRVYGMWFALAVKYRIYCATSEDGLTWQLLGKDEASTFRGGLGYDRVSLRVRHRGQRFMLYSDVATVAPDSFGGAGN